MPAIQANTDDQDKASGVSNDFVSVEIAASIVEAYVSHNAISAADLPRLITDVHQTLLRIGGEKEDVQVERKPAISVRKSITPEYLICLEDGKKFKSLKRHLRTQYNMSPDEYRAKWGLPADYPMVAPSYSEARSRLAKDIGLGQKPKATSPGRSRRAANVA
ncbi:MucR family transcriptional regulator [Devosia sp.]|uniref:MucR family transcriptional regulator n=1 Tax=Devosia sp. TaxID=1871048 RepID=UPI003A925176